MSTSAATEIWYPVVADVLALHDALMRGLGEHPPPLRAEGHGKLAGALAAAENAASYAYADLPEQAAVLAVRLAQAHAFLDNNKRLAYIVAVVFLRANGHPLPAEHSLVFARQIVAALEHTTTITDFGGWLREVLGGASSDLQPGALP